MDLPNIQLHIAGYPASVNGRFYLYLLSSDYPYSLNTSQVCVAALGIGRIAGYAEPDIRQVMLAPLGIGRISDYLDSPDIRYSFSSSTLQDVLLFTPQY